MEKGLFEIVSNIPVSPGVFRMRLRGEKPVDVRPGQFVDLELEGRYLRRPFGVADWNGNEIDLIYKTVGEGTRDMAAMNPGKTLGLLYFLGNGFDLSLCSSRALVVGGGLGVSPLYGLVRQLRLSGKDVSVVLGFNSDSEVILEDSFRALGAEVFVSTMDGSRGVKGFVTDCIRELILPQTADVRMSGGSAAAWDVFYSCGPRVMMKAVDALLPSGPGQFSLEERMGCGCGICYGCTCHTAGGPRRVCADGPVFNREDVIW